MSLYRLYRPKVFADVVGQDAVVSTLENAVSQGKLSHAYLFAGSRGTGKTSVARILAKAMLTQGMTDGKLAEQIRAAVDDGSLVDLVEIDGASYRRIEDSRDLVEKIQFSPVASAAKVYIIDEAHMLTNAAFNALLKTIEEPPPYAYFILATTELQKIPSTIQSRCQRFVFRQVPEEDIIRRLQFIADQERIIVDRPALRTIAHHADGAVRDAISLLDQLRSLPKIGADDVKERTGDSGHEIVEKIMAAIGGHDRKALLEIVRNMESAGISLESVTRMLLSVIRTQLHQAIDDGNPISTHARTLSLLLDTLRDIRIAPVPGLVLEAALLSLCNDPEASASAEPKTRIFGKKTASIAVSAKPSHADATAKAQSGSDSQADLSSEDRKAEEESASANVGPAPHAIIEAPELTISSIRDHWPAVLRDISPPSLKMSLRNGHVHALKASEGGGGRLTLGFASAFHRDKVAKTEASRAVEQILEKIFKRQLRVECILEEEENGPGGPDKEMVNLAEAAAEVF
ncbi:DNA polymerase III subunit gamma/tau [Candidatus Peregrinibacteria bacterium]|nr:DNA polymerase III subunit gamma/tau [Candidatus Peregrinibacteria bacterium]